MAQTIARHDSLCAVKLGNSYYINCQNLILFRDQPVMTLTNAEELINVCFDVFSDKGIKMAKVTNGILSEGDIKKYIIKSTGNEFSFIEKSTNRIICYIKKTYDNEAKRCELHVSVDMYMPGGFYFQCTPETTNNRILNMMQGNTFKNMRAGVLLN